MVHFLFLLNFFIFSKLEWSPLRAQGSEAHVPLAATASIFFLNYDIMCNHNVIFNKGAVSLTVPCKCLLYMYLPTPENPLILETLLSPAFSIALSSQSLEQQHMSIRVQN